MDTFADFIQWAGSQARAAELTGYSEATISRAVRGHVSKGLAEAADRVSDGLFDRRALLWPINDEGQEARHG